MTSFGSHAPVAPKSWADDTLTTHEALQKLTSAPANAVYISADVESVAVIPGEPVERADGSKTTRHHAIQIGLVVYNNIRLCDLTAENCCGERFTFNFPVADGFEMSADMKGFWGQEGNKDILAKIIEDGAQLGDEAFLRFHAFMKSVTIDAGKVATFVCMPASYDLGYLIDMVVRGNPDFVYVESGVHYRALCQSTMYATLKGLLFDVGMETKESITDFYDDEVAIQGPKHNAGVDAHRQCYTMCIHMQLYAGAIRALRELAEGRVWRRREGGEPIGKKEWRTVEIL